MITVEEHESIRRAYYLEGKSKRQIAREQGHSRKTVDKAIENRPAQPYRLTQPKPAPVFGAYRSRADELLAANAQLPRKQQYTAHKIYERLREEGYQGSEARVRLHVSQWNKAHKAPALFLPLEFEPGQDAQVDWGEAIAIIAGVKQTVQVFVMWLSYSRRRFVMAFPSQKQEAFFYGHVCAFEHFGGVPARISYDNLSTAVRLMVEGRVRREQRSFVSFRSYYLFESHFCQPGAGWEKGGVEASVGFSRRNFLVPIPDVSSFEELNRQLAACCLKDDNRRVSRQVETIGQMWEREHSRLASAAALCLRVLCHHAGQAQRLQPGDVRNEPLLRAGQPGQEGGHGQGLSLPHRDPGWKHAPGSPPAQLPTRAGCVRATALLAAVGTKTWGLRLRQAYAAMAQGLAPELSADVGCMPREMARRGTRGARVCARAALT